MDKIILFKRKNDNNVYTAFLGYDYTDNKLPEILKQIEAEKFIITTNKIFDNHYGEFAGERIWDDSKSDKISYNFPNIKEIWKNKWREKREEIFKKLDVDYMRALEQNDDKKRSEIVAKKEELRKITEIELPDDASVIIKTWPNCLNY
jgi:flagellar motility protein MotE (MotC chaperone)